MIKLTNNDRFPVDNIIPLENEQNPMTNDGLPPNELVDINTINQMLPKPSETRKLFIPYRHGVSKFGYGLGFSPLDHANRFRKRQSRNAPIRQVGFKFQFQIYVLPLYLLTNK